MFTDKQSLHALRHAVQQRGRDCLAPGASTPGYAGPSSCKYWDTEKNEPSCLIGNALTILGVDRETLIREDETGESFLISELSHIRAFSYVQPSYSSYVRSCTGLSGLRGVVG